MRTALRNRYFGLRHGESLANVAGEVAGDPARAVMEVGLSAAGRATVERGARAAAAVPGGSAAAAALPRETLIVSSDLRRAHESAEVVRAAIQSGPVRLDPRLRERRFGLAEGCPHRLYQRAWEVDARDATASIWGGESVASVAARLQALLLELEAVHAGQTVLLVSHGDPLQILRAVLAGRGPGRHREGAHWEPGVIAPLVE